MVLYKCLALHLLVYSAVRVHTGSNFSLTNVTGYFLLIILQPVTLYFDTICLNCIPLLKQSFYEEHSSCVSVTDLLVRQVRWKAPNA